MSASVFPFQPLCCTSAIPSSFRHVLGYVPVATEHVLYSAKPTNGSAGLIATFLTSVTTHQVYPSNMNPPLEEREDLRPNGSFRAIIQLMKTISTIHLPSHTSEVSKQYYVPYGSGERDRIILGNNEKLFGILWKEVSQADAEWCIKPEGSGFDIGDGERWKELSGAEKLWCEQHRVFWEFKAFVRLS
jgi:hypothetical protein